MLKPKLAFYWCAGCGGCEESLVDLAEDLLVVVERADIVFWPVAMDFKYSDLESLSDGSIEATLINGALQTDEQERVVKLLRKKSKYIMAHGACAHLGGVVGLANFSERQEVLGTAYIDAPSVNNPEHVLPAVGIDVSGQALSLPKLSKSVKALDAVIDVDYYIPGCPPNPELIKEALMACLDSNLPAKGWVFADSRSLCDSCSRRDSKPDRVKIKKFKRLHQVSWDPARCFLDQGIICLGPSTRGGCKERCIGANMPCRGCYGATGDVGDQGAKSLSFLASLLETNDEKEIKRIMDSIVDPAGLFYRYSLASSQLKGKIR